MHAINICISCYYDIIVTKVFKPVFNIQSRLKEVELIILVYDPFT